MVCPLINSNYFRQYFQRRLSLNWQTVPAAHLHCGSVRAAAAEPAGNAHLEAASHTAASHKPAFLREDNNIRPRAYPGMAAEPLQAVLEVLVAPEALQLVLVLLLP
ncbi:hypothetical protein D3C74_350610 [compost metagenome]